MRFSWSEYTAAAKARLSDPTLYVIAVVTLVISVVNIMTKLSDAAGYGRDLALANPITTEFSSAFALIILMPLLFGFFDRLPLSLENWRRALVPYIIISIIFSVLHVAMMVGMRKLAWPILFDGSYRFFSKGYGALVYEYRKDMITFALYVIIAELQHQIAAAKAAKQQAVDPITLKSGATTILLQPAEFLYAKSAGNYAEVTSLSGMQLARVTLTELETALQEKGCDAVRIHRSYIVNKAAIMETSPIAGGDLTIKLRGGETLRASRRYKEVLEADAQPHARVMAL